MDDIIMHADHLRLHEILNKFGKILYALKYLSFTVTVLVLFGFFPISSETKRHDYVSNS